SEHLTLAVREVDQPAAGRAGVDDRSGGDGGDRHAGWTTPARRTRRSGPPVEAHERVARDRVLVGGTAVVPGGVEGVVRWRVGDAGRGVRPRAADRRPRRAVVVRAQDVIW